jgi:hypothetical protein
MGWATFWATFLQNRLVTLVYKHVCMYAGTAEALLFRPQCAALLNLHPSLCAMVEMFCRLGTWQIISHQSNSTILSFFIIDFIGNRKMIAIVVIDLRKRGRGIWDFLGKKMKKKEKSKWIFSQLFGIWDQCPIPGFGKKINMFLW